MAFLRTTSDNGLPVTGRRVMLRAPTTFDYVAWSELRGASASHLQPFEPAWASDELSRWAFRRRLRQYARDLADDASYPLFIVSPTSGTLYGGITLSNVRRGVAQTASIGYWIGAKHAGQGLMSDALLSVLPFAFDHLRLHRLEAACLPHNAASMRVLEKAGFQQEGLARQYLRINGSWQDHVLFALTEDDRRGGVT
jgi:[ribosomal protein S5]-alanine N-acetyltransferase